MFETEHFKGLEAGTNIGDNKRIKLLKAKAKEFSRKFSEGTTKEVPPRTRPL